MTASWARPVRAALVALSASGLPLGVLRSRVDSDHCDRSGDGCLELAVVVLALGVPVLVLLVAWALRGKGVINALAGSVVCFCLAVLIAQRRPAWVDQHDAADAAFFALVYALLVLVWARLTSAPPSWLGHPKRRQPR